MLLTSQAVEFGYLELLLNLPRADRSFLLHLFLAFRRFIPFTSVSNLHFSTMFDTNITLKSPRRIYRDIPSHPHHQHPINAACLPPSPPQKPPTSPLQISTPPKPLRNQKRQLQRLFLIQPRVTKTLIPTPFQIPLPQPFTPTYTFRDRLPRQLQMHAS